jgi:hypothetical protein
MEYTATNTHLPNVNPRTLFQIRPPNNQRVKLWGIDLGLQGSTPATAPVPFDILLQTTAGTATALTGQTRDRGTDESIQADMWKDFSAEPTASTILIEFSVHQQGLFPWRPPFPVIVKGGERVGFRYKSGTFVTVSFTVHLSE